MTAIKPATDEEIAEWEKHANYLGVQLHTPAVLAIIARIRQEQRRAEAAEKVVEAMDRYFNADCGSLNTTSKILDLVREAYDAAKAKGFP